MVFTGGSREMEVVISGDASGLQRAVATSNTSILSLKNAVAGLGVAMGALAAGGLAKSISAAADFDAAMTESLAIMGDVSNAMRKDMSDAAREVAKTTTFSAEQAAESYFFLASAGLDASESMAVLDDMAQFAQAGMFDMATATDILTDAASALGLEVDEYNDLADTMVKTNQLANTSVEQLGEALTNKAAARMRQLNVETEEGVAVLAAYADQGIKGRKAGERLNIVLRDLVAASRENAGAFEEMGISVFDAEGNMRAMDDIIRDFEEATEGMTVQQREAALATLGLSKQAADGISPLLGMSGAIGEYSDELKNAEGATKEVAQKQLQTFNAQLDLLKSRIVDAAIGIGTVFLPHLTNLVKGINSFLDSNNKVLGGITEAQKAFGLLGVAVGGTAFGVISFVKSIKTALLVVGGLGGAILLLAKLWMDNFAGIRDITMRVLGAVLEQFRAIFPELKFTVETVLNDIVGAFGGAGGGIEAEVARFLGNVEAIFTMRIAEVGAIIRRKLAEFRVFWAAHGDEIIAEIQAAYTKFREIAQAALQALIDIVSRSLAKILTFWNNNKEQIIGVLRTLFTILRSVVTTALGALVTIWQQNFDGIVNVVTKTVELIVDSFTTFMTILLAVIQPILAEIQQLWDQHGKDIALIVTTLADIIITLVTALMDTIVTIMKVVLGVIQFIWKNFGNEIIAVVTFITDVIFTILGTFLDMLATMIRVVTAAIAGDWSAVWNEIAGLFQRVLTGIINFVANWGRRFFEYLNGLLTKVINAFIAWGKKLIFGSVVKDVFTAIITAAITFGTNFLNTIITWLGNVFTSFVQWTTDMVTEFTEFVADVLNKLVEFTGQFITNLANFMLNAWNRWVNFRNSVYQLVIDWLTDILTRFITFTVNFINALADFIIDAVNRYFQFWNDVFNLAVEWLGKLLDEFITWAGDTISEFAEFVGNFLSDAETFLSNLWDKFDTWFGNIKDNVLEIAGNLKDEVIEIIKAIGTEGARKLKNAWNTAIPSSVGIDPFEVGGQKFGGFSIPLPQLQRGGILTSGITPAMLHGPEAILPLNDRGSRFLADAIGELSVDGGDKTIVHIRELYLEADDTEAMIDDIIAHTR